MKTWTPSQPLSWFAFLLGVALGFLVFAPLTLLGVAYEKIPLFLTGMTGIGLSFFAAAFMGLKLATGIADGRYRDVHPAPWREQVW
jgi:hypothetical protein